MTKIKTGAVPPTPTLVFIAGKWQLQTEVEIFWKNFRFTVPKDYRCDLGSVPWVFSWAVQSTGKGNLAFLAHDFVYDDDTTLPVSKIGMQMTRAEGDMMMRDLLEFSGMSKWRRIVAWRGVRRGGWISFKRKD